MDIYFITSNNGKYNEAKNFLSDVAKLHMVSIDLKEIQSLDSQKIIESKMQEAEKISKYDNIIIEDTSLEIQGMNGLPGPFVKFFIESIGKDGIYSLSETFGSDAIAKCTVGYRESDGKTHFFEGKIQGKIVKPKGDRGFGWDSIFMPDGYNKTFSEMNLDEKNTVSHRNLAFSKLRKHLQKTSSL